MATASIAITEDNRCPYSADGPTLFLGDEPITPATHYALAPAVGARRAALLPFPSQRDACGALLTVLCQEDGFAVAPAAPPAAVADGANQGHNQGNQVNNDADAKGRRNRGGKGKAKPSEPSALDPAEPPAGAKDHFLLLSAHEPLDGSVYAFLCRRLSELAAPAATAKIDKFVVVHAPSVEFGHGVQSGDSEQVAQLCQLSRAAEFLQCKVLVDECRQQLRLGWCTRCEEASAGVRGDDNTTLRLEGLVRKTSTMLRRARKSLNLRRDVHGDTAFDELLEKLDEWSSQDHDGQPAPQPPAHLTPAQIQQWQQQQQQQQYALQQQQRRGQMCNIPVGKHVPAVLIPAALQEGDCNGAQGNVAVAQHNLYDYFER